MWIVLFSGSDVVYVKCSVNWPRYMWIVLFTDSVMCGLFCLLALIYVECSVHWL